MGFFDSLLRGVKNEVKYDLERKAANAIGSAVTNTIQNGINKPNVTVDSGSNTVQQSSTINNHQGVTVPSNNPVQASPNMMEGIDYSRNYNCDDKHFREILKNNFPDMELREDVPLNQIIPGLNNAYQSVSFLLSQQGTPKVVIQLRYPHQASRKGSARECQKNGIGYISLWRDYKNQEEYVVKRVKDALWN